MQKKADLNPFTYMVKILSEEQGAAPADQIMGMMAESPSNRSSICKEIINELPYIFL